MSTEYYLVCPDKKCVLELYKEHQYLLTLNSISGFSSFDEFSEYIREERLAEEKDGSNGVNSHLSQEILTKVIAFLKDCNGSAIYHFSENQYIDWWYENDRGYNYRLGIPGMSKLYPEDWTVYEW